jgi:hypothetical protein
MSDRPGYSNELFRFSTTERKWEQLNATRVSGSPPSPGYGDGMVSVGSDLYVFGGEEGLSDACHRLGACQIERLGGALRIVAVLVVTFCARARPCRAAPGSGDSGRHIIPLLAP